MPATYKKIASVTLASTAAAIEFTSIPATYTDLFVLFSGRGSGGSDTENCKVQLNGETSNFSDRIVQGFGNSTSSDTDTGIRMKIPAASSTTSTFSNSSVYIPNYTGSTNKSVSVESVSEKNSATGNVLHLSAGLWSATSAITSVKIVIDSGSLVQHSTATLYGILKA